MKNDLNQHSQARNKAAENAIFIFLTKEKLSKQKQKQTLNKY